MTKKEIRKIYIEKRKAISSKEKLRLDDLLLLQFQQLSFAEIQVLFTYWPMVHQAEPNTHLFSSYLRHMIPGLHMAYPVINKSSQELIASVISEDTVYTTNTWGITEPSVIDEIEAAAIDCVLVPLLAFDKSGFRVGYGKGYYDKFLSRCREDVIKIGFSYFDAIDKIDDTNEFDVPLTYCITPQSIYEF